MAEILTYKVIAETHLSELVKKVNESLSEGWEPIGGVTNYDGTSLQAMVYRRRSDATQTSE